MNYIVYCDGSARGNGTEHSCGAYAYVITNEKQDIQLDSGVAAIAGTTNQRMELEAALAAYRALVSKFGFGENDTATFYSDSKYLIDCYQHKWYDCWRINKWRSSRRLSVSNRDLWEQLAPIFDLDNTGFEYVPAHQPDAFFQSHEYWNNQVDWMAQRASLELKNKLMEGNTK